MAAGHSREQNKQRVYPFEDEARLNNILKKSVLSFR
jgi:hypothetical protein